MIPVKPGPSSLNIYQVNSGFELTVSIPLHWNIATMGEGLVKGDTPSKIISLAGRDKLVIQRDYHDASLSLIRMKISVINMLLFLKLLKHLYIQYLCTLFISTLLSTRWTCSRHKGGAEIILHELNYLHQYTLVCILFRFCITNGSVWSNSLHVRVNRTLWTSVIVNFNEMIADMLAALRHLINVAQAWHRFTSFTIMRN